MSYAKARSDFEYLESIAHIKDFVEVDAQVIDLMQCPTKDKAEQLYNSAIHLWLQQHMVGDRRRILADARVLKIATWYGWEL